MQAVLNVAINITRIFSRYNVWRKASKTTFVIFYFMLKLLQIIKLKRKYSSSHYATFHEAIRFRISPNKSFFSRHIMTLQNWLTAKLRRGVITRTFPSCLFMPSYVGGRISFSMFFENSKLLTPIHLFHIYTYIKHSKTSHYELS